MEPNHNLTTLKDLLNFDAQKFINAEVQLKNTLPEWIAIVSSLQLKSVLHKYLDFVDMHIKRINDFLNEEEIEFQIPTDKVMHAYIDEAEEKLITCTDPPIKDACLLANIQLINHYKISAYGTAAAFSSALDMEKHALVFQELELNEKQIDERLSQLAKIDINIRAMSPILLNG
jgi:ferritin-like metal-binding protein YciE